MKQSVPHLIFVLTALVTLYSCSGDSEVEKPIKWNTEQSTTMNKQFSAEEEVDINLFLSRKQEWNMTKTGSGLRYFIYENGAGKRVFCRLFSNQKFIRTKTD
mgnify:CR=1 FL=1